jgi:parallel beta-helix repeat protein
MRRALVVISILALVSIFALPTGSCAAEVHDILLSKNDYIVNSQASAFAVLNFTGSANQLEDVNFMWYRPDMSVALSENVPPADGLAMSDAIVDTIGLWWINASYSGDPSKYINRSMKVYESSWSGTIYAQDWIIVGDGTVLTIADGSEVRFSNDTGLRIEGTLNAEGVLFTSNSSSPAQGDWDSIVFWSLSDPTSAFHNNTVEYADDGIKIQTVSQTIRHNTFRNNVNGITLFSSSTLVWKNDFTDNANGIELYGSSPTLFDNTFSENSYSIRCLQSPDVTIDGNTIQDTGQTGIYVYASTVHITSNTIQQGDGSGIHFTDASSGLVDNTTVTEFNDGLSVRGSSTVTVKDSDISSNTARNMYIEDSTATAINYTTKQKLSSQQGGLLYFKNYLTVSVNHTDGSKISNAAVSVYSDSQAEKSSFTDASGMTPPMLVLDRILTSTGSVERVTVVEVVVPGMAFAGNSRFVDMSASHTEYFVGSRDDNDGDGDPDFSDPDDDNDGLWDSVEAGLGTHPFNPDSDGDGLIDGFEVNVLGSDPLLLDTDGDGYTDKEEYDAGTSTVNPENHPEDGALDDDDGDAASGDETISASIIFAFQALAFLLSLLFIRQRKGLGKS